MAKRIRSDGRLPEELRSIRIEAGVLERADGSARVEWGLRTKVLRVPKDDEKTIRELMETYYIKVKETPPDDVTRQRVLEAELATASAALNYSKLVAYTAGLYLEDLHEVCRRAKLIAAEEGKDITEELVMHLVDEVRREMRRAKEPWMLVDVPEKLLDHVKELKSYEVVGEGFRGNVAVVAVYGPREPLPKHVGDPYRAIIRFAYRMAPFSVPERKRPAPGRREIEISKVSKEALQRIVFAEEYPMTVIDVFAELLSADAGTRVTALTAASVALADAGIPMRDLLTALAVGKIPVGGEETVVADLTKFEEDLEGAVDIPVAVSPRTGDVHLLQMDGRISKEQLEEALDLALKKAKEIYALQKDALKEKYRRVVENE